MTDQHQNAVIVIGTTGCGKSYVSSKIFEVCENTRRFVSSDANLPVTLSIQTETISYRGKQYNITDCPGFFDNNNKNPGGDDQARARLFRVLPFSATPEMPAAWQYSGPGALDSGNDGPNLCKLVQALEMCESIVTILYVYTGRFSTPQKIWFDRINSLVPEARRGNIIIVHNKLNTVADGDLQARNKLQINHLIGDGANHPYIWFGWHAPLEQVRRLLDELEKLPTFQLRDLTIPEICYEREEEGPEYMEVIGERIQDHGENVTRVVDKGHWDVRYTWNRGHPFGALGIRGPGAKSKEKTWVPHLVSETRFVSKKMTHKTTATYKNVYKVRFDGKRVLKEKKCLGQSETVSRKVPSCLVS